MIYKGNCKNCGGYYEGRGKMFCSITCRNMFFSGEKSFTWSGGKPKCIDCGKQLARRNAKRCKSCAAMGEFGNNWKGGVTKLYISIRNCAKYNEWRKKIYRQDNYTCANCGSRNGMGETVILNADHFPKKMSTIIKENNITTLKDAMGCKELWDTNNGRTLCLKCHSKIDGFSINFRRIILKKRTCNYKLIKQQ